MQTERASDRARTAGFSCDEARAAHRVFLNRYYGPSRFIYDLSRKYFLLGRDAALRSLAVEGDWSSLAEMGSGTGRNLIQLHRARPSAIFGGIEASDAMLSYARKRCPWAKIVSGFAEDARIEDCTGTRPDRILFSYCLSMVGDRSEALANARRSVAPDGRVIVVDFADMRNLPSAFSRSLRRYLRAFRVEPLDEKLLSDAESVCFGPGRYYVIARFRPERLPRSAHSSRPANTSM